MKDKFIKALAFAIVSIISAALVTYLKDPEHRMELKIRAREYKNKLQKSARKTKNSINMRLERYNK